MGVCHFFVTYNAVSGLCDNTIVPTMKAHVQGACLVPGVDVFMVHVKRIVCSNDALLPTRNPGMQGVIMMSQKVTLMPTKQSIDIKNVV